MSSLQSTENRADYNPLVSIIIPCYNTEKYIGEAIDSALSQNYQPIEVIVVDDGSTDNSVEVIQTYSNLVRLERNKSKGACAARNLGLALSKGTYIQFLDADDVLLPNKLSIQLPFLTSAQCDLIFCNGYLFGDGRARRPIKRLQTLPKPDGIDPFMYLLENGIGTEGPLHSRRLLEKVGGFRDGLAGAQEYDLHVRLGAAGARIHKVDDYLFCHRHHDDPGRITRTPKPPGFMVETLIELLERTEEDTSAPLNSKRRQAYANRLFQKSIHAYRNGAELSAEKGFALAQNLCSHIEYNERSIYKLAARVTNPMAVEACLKQLRSLRSKLTRTSKLLTASLR